MRCTHWCSSHYETLLESSANYPDCPPILSPPTAQHRDFFFVKSSPTKTVPTYVPAETRDHLTTPCGLLFNELLKSPKVPPVVQVGVFRSFIFCFVYGSRCSPFFMAECIHSYFEVSGVDEASWENSPSISFVCLFHRKLQTKWNCI